MKKFLFVLLASAAVTPAMAQNWNYATGQQTQQRTYQQRTYQSQQQQRVAQPTYRQPQQAQYSAPATKSSATTQYKLGNPLNRPAAGSFVIDGNATYYYAPKDDSVPQEKTTGWSVAPGVDYGITDKLSVGLSMTYGEFEAKKSKEEASVFMTSAYIRYLILSVDGFDVNVEARANYSKMRAKEDGEYLGKTRNNGPEVSLQIGKKIDMFTPYFKVGFESDLWAKKHCAHGTSTYINPGIYMDFTNVLGLDVSYTSETHDAATYKAELYVYPTDNLMLGFGSYILAPETAVNEYGFSLDFRMAF